MVDYLGDSSYQHGSSSRIGVLLANLGTPDGPDPVLGPALPGRVPLGPAGRRSAAPDLVAGSARRDLCESARRRALTPISRSGLPKARPCSCTAPPWPSESTRPLQPRWNAVVALGMSYGSPSIPQALEELRRQGAQRIVVLPLYPQYSGNDDGIRLRSRHSTAATLALGAGAALHQQLSRRRRLHRCARRQHRATLAHARKESFAVLFPRHPQELRQRGRPVLLRKHEDRAPGRRAPVAGRERVERELPIAGRPSRNGCGHTPTNVCSSTLRSGPKRVTLVCPGFATDCLETLEEIALRNRQLFLDAGGEAYDYVPALECQRCARRRVDYVDRAAHPRLGPNSRRSHSGAGRSHAAASAA